MPTRIKEPVMMLLDYLMSLNVLTFSISFAVIGQFVTEYVFADWQFAIYLTVAMVVDTIVGMMKAWKKGKISDKGYSQILVKIILYFCVLVISHVLTNFLVHGQNNGLFDWVDKVFYVALIVREAISIIRNIAIIQPGLIPNVILKRLEDFDETGVLK